MGKAMPNEGMENARTGCIMGIAQVEVIQKLRYKKEPVADIRGTGYLGDTADLKK
jgi:hypothetical protein